LAIVRTFSVTSSPTWTVAARRGARQHAVDVGDREGQAVDLGLDDEDHV
jgi:hypothetical protein